MSSDAMKIALSGLNDATLRVATSAQNIANSGVTGRLPTEDNASTTAYMPQDVISTSASAGGVNLGVSSTTTTRQPAYVASFDPTSNDADANGSVATPNVDLATEILNAQMASNAYRANVAVIKTVDENSKKLIDALS
jgi:flagellar basal-body rod protein FlgC